MDHRPDTRRGSAPVFDLHQCVDALVTGEWTEDQLLTRALTVSDRDHQSAWSLLAIIDQRYRRGQLPGHLFHSLKTRIARRALCESSDAVTEELARTAPVGASPEFVATTPPTLRVGRILRNRYVVEGQLGRGGMGDVFKASDGLSVLRPGSSSHVAIKVLRQGARDSPENMARLRREFSCAHKLSHPNIVKVYDFDREGELAFYTMEILDGEQLRELLRRRRGRPLPSRFAWGIIRAIGAALAHAHSRNVVHGDVSPKNVMITRGGTVRVLDFGSSTMSLGIADPRPAVAATPAYASCELLGGYPAGPSDDLYALSCLAYELLCSQHPFQGRRSTDARALGLRARRPAGIRAHQWRTLKLGLSWTRADRYMPIQEWLAKLGQDIYVER